jgi:hypothetical protein
MEAVVVYFKVLFKTFLEGTEKKHEKRQGEDRDIKGLRSFLILPQYNTASQPRGPRLEFSLPESLKSRKVLITWP